MGAFEEFVNSNLGIRQPLIWDNVPPTLSPKAAGVLGSHFLDTTTHYLYEKTGYDDTIDWVKIGKLGDERGGKPGGEDKYIQFNSGGDPDRLSGSQHFIYDYDLELVSGLSGHFDFLSGTNAGFQNATITQDLNVLGDLYVTGTSHVTKVIDYTIDGEISGKTGIFESFESDYITGTTGYFDTLYVDNGSIKDLQDDLDLVSGESFSSFLALSVDLYDTGKHLEEKIDLISGESFSSFLALSVDLYDSGQYLMENAGGSKEDVEKLKVDLVNVSGESLANFISVADDISLMDESIELVSGESLANFISVADDISFLDESLEQVSGESLANFISAAEDISAINERIDNLEIGGANDNAQNSLKINNLSGDFTSFKSLTSSNISSINGSISSINNVIANLSEQEALLQLKEEVKDLSGESYTSFLTLTADLFESGEYLESSVSNLSKKVNDISGESYTSFLTLTADLFESGEYLEEKIDSSNKVTIQEDSPTSPREGDLWWESDVGRLKIYYHDGSSAYWVDASPQGAGGGGSSNSEMLYTRFSYSNTSPSSAQPNTDILGLSIGQVSVMDTSFGGGSVVNSDPTLTSISFDNTGGHWVGFRAGTFEISLNMLVDYDHTLSSPDIFNHKIEYNNNGLWKFVDDHSFVKPISSSLPATRIKQSVVFSSIVSFTNTDETLNKLRVKLDSNQSDKYYIPSARLTIKQIN